MRRNPLGFQKEEETLLQSMPGEGIVQPSESEWAAASVIERNFWTHLLFRRSFAEVLEGDMFLCLGQVLLRCPGSPQL